MKSITKKLINIAATAVLTITTSLCVVAGPYSTGLNNTNAGAIDAGIAGFIGAAGEGVTATTSNGNYVNPAFKGWATGVVDYSPAPGVAANWQNASNALGEVTGNNMGIVTLGDLRTTASLPSVDPTVKDDAYGFIGYDDPSQITLSFSNAICNGSGADFAVFENGFISNSSGLLFAELGYVEVSSNGIDFARFPSVSLTKSLVGGYGCIDPTDVYNLVGKHVNAYGNSWGTPFDLDDLFDNSLVVNGTVDLNNIGYMRIVDIPGSGDYKDSEGNPIYDAWVTYGSGGLDLEAVGVINTVPEPSSLIALMSGAIGLIGFGIRKRNI